MKVLAPVPFWAVLAPEGRSAKAAKQPSNRERVITRDPGSWLVPLPPSFSMQSSRIDSALTESKVTTESARVGFGSKASSTSVTRESTMVR